VIDIVNLKNTGDVRTATRTNHIGNLVLSYLSSASGDVNISQWVLMHELAVCHCWILRCAGRRTFDYFDAASSNSVAMVNLSHTGVISIQDQPGLRNRKRDKCVVINPGVIKPGFTGVDRNTATSGRFDLKDVADTCKDSITNNAIKY